MEENRRLQVLVADDNEINRILLRKMFVPFPLDMDFVENGKEAYEKVLSMKYDIVLMDIYMPVLDGWEASKKIRELEDDYFKKLPIIALTASAPGDIDKNLIVANGLNDYQSKPFKPDELYNKIILYTTKAAV